MAGQLKLCLGRVHLICLNRICVYDSRLCEHQLSCSLVQSALRKPIKVKSKTRKGDPRDWPTYCADYVTAWNEERDFLVPSPFPPASPSAPANLALVPYTSIGPCSVCHPLSACQPLPSHSGRAAGKCGGASRWELSCHPLPPHSGRAAGKCGGARRWEISKKVKANQENTF
uniref:Uncharacterized protein n=1 Tax=Nelumbo nucifera TaxID=4432 RepID=A0A822ZDW2_NELNU|nr:TPA_asm: hypothetical protein HUJ06_001003 [Nelumbo nucifera]